MAGPILNVAAPPIPCKTRMAINISSDVDNAQPTEASVKTLRPKVKTERNPRRLESAAKIASVIAADSR
ncbi:hypothetical protein D3C75_1258460 [compost metagenome]